MHESSMMLMKYFRDTYLTDMKGASILDIGSKADSLNSPRYADIFGDYEYIGMDIVSGINVDLVGYESITNPYDVVVSGQTMEHVKRPWEWLKNLTNYFTKFICVIAPHTWKEHRRPFDTYRYFPDGMRDLFNYAGIKEFYIARNRTDTIGVGGK